MQDAFNILQTFFMFWYIFFKFDLKTQHCVFVLLIII